MHEKDLGVSEYLDLYGDILEDRQRQIMDMYYNDDYSLSEISEITGITRQGVSESVRKSVKRLHEMEDKLHLKARLDRFESEKDTLANQLSVYIKDDAMGLDLIERIKELSI